MRCGRRTAGRSSLRGLRRRPVEDRLDVVDDGPAHQAGHGAKMRRFFFFIFKKNLNFKNIYPF